MPDRQTRELFAEELPAGPTIRPGATRLLKGTLTYHPGRFPAYWLSVVVVERDARGERFWMFDLQQAPVLSVTRFNLKTFRALVPPAELVARLKAQALAADLEHGPPLSTPDGVTVAP